MRTSLIKTYDQARACGRGTARGTSGTGWMAALDTIVDEAITEARIKTWPPDVEMAERLATFAWAWTESHQFEHEVGQFLSAAEGEEQAERLAELQDAWVDGYIEVLTEKIGQRMTA